MKKRINIKTVCLILLGLSLGSFKVLASTTIDIQTTLGTITVELADETAPVTVNNFLNYVDEGFYKDTVFHRVIHGFMIQGGGFNAELEASEVHAPIILESNVGLSNKRGTISMARRPAPDSASSQFFINTVDNVFLDYQGINSPGYAVFGEVIAGMEVVDAISQQATGIAETASGFLRNVPVSPIIIEAVRLRDGQLAFTDMREQYAPGDTLIVTLEETMHRDKIVDLWAAVLTEQGMLYYVTEQGFSLDPSALKKDVAMTETRHSVFELTVPEGLTGHFTLFAVFNHSGEGITDLSQSLRSNIAMTSVELLP